jgi:transposase
MSKQRKQRLSFTVEQRLDYAKLMVNEDYTNQQIMEISGAASTAVSRWKKQHLEELDGKIPEGKKGSTALNPLIIICFFVCIV